MAVLDSIKVLAAPAMYVDGVLIAVVPNSVTVSIPGEVKVRSMSAGGGATVPVVGLDAESLKAMVKFEIASTAANIELTRSWRAKSIDGAPSACF
jgi:hypothetical protein